MHRLFGALRHDQIIDRGKYGRGGEAATQRRDGGANPDIVHCGILAGTTIARGRATDDTDRMEERSPR
jgi:hypothetical protein